MARQHQKSPRSLSSTSIQTPWPHKGQHHGHEWTTHIPFVPCQLALPFLRQGNFKLCSWNFKVKVMGVVKGQGHVVSPVDNSFTSFWLHISQTNNSWDTTFSKVDLEKSKVKVIGEVKGQGPIVHPAFNWCTSCFVSLKSDQPFLRYGQQSVWAWKPDAKFWNKLTKKEVSNRISPKSNQVISMTR